MKSIRSFMTSIGRGFVGSFYRSRAGQLVCKGTAAKSDLAAYVKLATTSPPLDAVAISAVEMQEAAGTVHAQTIGQGSSGGRSARETDLIDWTGKSK